MADSIYLADTNVLLRLVSEDHPRYAMIWRAVHTLRERGMWPAYTMQNMAEFWNVSTRPRERNGFGLTAAEAEQNAQTFERSFVFLADSEATYREWRRLVVQYSVAGVQVHDARLVASMRVHQVRDILTFNASDFSRYEGIRAIDPAVV